MWTASPLRATNRDCIWYRVRKKSNWQTMAPRSGSASVSRSWISCRGRGWSLTELMASR